MSIIRINLPHKEKISFFSNLEKPPPAETELRAESVAATAAATAASL